MRRSLQQIMTTRLVAIAAALVALAFAAAPARAQCGSPPDPQYNTAGYASWCSCMGGTYNYQTTACTGAHGPSTSSGTRRRSSSGPPAQHWYCRARARNGASGWARYGDRATAERNALSYCRQYSKGRACRIVGCSYVGGTPPAGTGSRTTTAPSQPPATGEPAAPAFTPFRKPAVTCGGRKCKAGQICGPTNRCYDPQRHFYCGQTRCVTGRRYSASSACGKCTAAPQRAAPRLPFPFGAKTCSQCYRKLLADIRFGFLTRKPRSYIGHAISGYENCKAQAKGDCSRGDLFKAAVGGCRNPHFGAPDVRVCVSQALKDVPPGQ